MTSGGGVQSTNQPQFSDEQIELGIADAVRERKFEMVRSLLGLLAMQNPRRAQLILDAIYAVSGLGVGCE